MARRLLPGKQQALEQGPVTGEPRHVRRRVLGGIVPAADRDRADVVGARRERGSLGAGHGAALEGQGVDRGRRQQPEVAGLGLEQVTVYGLSAGGKSVTNLLASPLAKARATWAGLHWQPGTWWAVDGVS
jgi:hypothetical protein